MKNLYLVTVRVFNCKEIAHVTYVVRASSIRYAEEAVDSELSPVFKIRELCPEEMFREGR